MNNFYEDLAQENFIIEHFSVGPLGCVCTIIGDLLSGEALIIDAGAEADHILERVNKHRLRVTHLLHTHAHIDHVGATSQLRERCQAQSALHPADLPLSRTVAQQAKWLGLPTVPEPIFDNELFDHDIITVGRLHLKALHTPGHTPGSTSFALEYAASALLLTGDTLFSGAVGRWDIGGTSLEDILTSIRTQLLPYPDHSIVIPGHGSATSIGQERRTNPYLTTLFQKP